MQARVHLVLFHDRLEPKGSVVHPQARKPNSRRSIYRRSALTSSLQVAATALPLAVVILTSHFVAAVVLFCVVETVLVLGVSELAVFRRYVDACARREALCRAACLRSQWLVRMGAAHRAELERLEEVVARIGRAAGVEPEGDESWIGLDRALGLFVELAVAHRDNLLTFTEGDEVRIAAETAHLESRVAATANDPWQAHHLDILRRRRAAHRRARQERSIIEQQLATIGALVRWMHEESTCHRPSRLDVDLADVLATASHSSGTVREIVALRAHLGVDGETLRLGRRDVAAPPAAHVLPPDPPFLRVSTSVEAENEPLATEMKLASAAE